MRELTNFRASLGRKIILNVPVTIEETMSFKTTKTTTTTHTQTHKRNEADIRNKQRSFSFMSDWERASRSLKVKYCY